MTCQFYVTWTCHRAGSAASTRENSKRTKYRALDNFYFCPISIETMGSWGEHGRKLIDEIGKKLNQSTGEQRSKSFLLQRISIANQRGNAASKLGTRNKTSINWTRFTTLCNDNSIVALYFLTWVGFCWVDLGWVGLQIGRIDLDRALRTMFGLGWLG